MAIIRDTIHTMKNLLNTIVLSSLVLFGFACAPQQTDIVTEIHRTDGSVLRYVNKSHGFGYNPNSTSNLNIGGIKGTDDATIINNDGGYYGGVYYGPYGWGGYYNSGYYGGCGGTYPSGFVYQPGCVTTPGAAPIPYPTSIYNWQPGVSSP